MRAGLYAGIASDTFFYIPYYLSLCYSQSPCRTGFYTGLAMIAQILRLGVMAIFTLDITSLQKYCRAVSGTVHRRMVDNFINRCFKHQSEPFFHEGGLTCSWRFRSEPYPEAPLHLYHISRYRFSWQGSL